MSSQTKEKPDAIFLDCDGVLVDFASAALRLLGRSPEDLPTQWDFLGDSPEAVADFWNAFHTIDWKVSAFRWATLSATPEGRMLWSVCRQAAPTLLITAPAPEPFKELSMRGKRAWCGWWAGVEPLFTESPEDRARLARPGSLLIDDYDANVAAWQKAGGQAWLLKRPWNAHDPSGLEAQEIIRRLTKMVEP